MVPATEREIVFNQVDPTIQAQNDQQRKRYHRAQASLHYPTATARRPAPVSTTAPSDPAICAALDWSMGQGSDKEPRWAGAQIVGRSVVALGARSNLRRQI